MISYMSDVYMCEACIRQQKRATHNTLQIINNCMYVICNVLPCIIIIYHYEHYNGTPKVVHMYT
jgi:hypothetical protein